MGILLAIVRTVILVGAVGFSFALLGFGFHVVVREYRMLRTRKQIEEFLRMTNESGIQADAAKGTISLNRTRPGILLVAIGAVILMVCVFQTFQYETTSQQAGAQLVHLPTRAEREAVPQSVAPTPSSIPTPNVVATPPQTSDGARNLPFVLGYPASVTRLNPQPVTLDAPAEPVSRGVTVETVEALRVDILNNWLLDAESFRGKSLGEQAELLRKKYGDAAVGFDSLMLDRPATVTEIAKIAYGSSKYAQLLRMSNPNLPTDETPVPSYQNIYFLQPLLALATPSSSTSRTLMRITAGESKSQLYETVLNLAQQVMQSLEYKSDPPAWWKQRGGLTEFERGLSSSTQRKWAMKFYKPEKNESPETVAKIFYGSAKFAKLISFFNYDKTILFANPKAPFPSETELVILYLAEL